MPRLVRVKQPVLPERCQQMNILVHLQESVIRHHTDHRLFTGRRAQPPDQGIDLLQCGIRFRTEGAVLVLDVVERRQVYGQKPGRFSSSRRTAALARR